MNISNVLKNIADSEYLNNVSLGKICGISGTYANQIMQGLRTPTKKTELKILESLRLNGYDKYILDIRDKIGAQKLTDDGTGQLIDLIISKVMPKIEELIDKKCAEALKIKLPGTDVNAPQKNIRVNNVGKINKI